MLYRDKSSKISLLPIINGFYFLWMARTKWMRCIFHSNVLENMSLLKMDYCICCIYDFFASIGRTDGRSKGKGKKCGTQAYSLMRHKNPLAHLLHFLCILLFGWLKAFAAAAMPSPSTHLLDYNISFCIMMLRYIMLSGQAGDFWPLPF